MPRPAQGRKPKTIAVGGSKGGIGKSVFAANLGVLLASHGRKTVVVDLDLGGANMHFYLGHSRILKRNINDFLRNRVTSLEDVMIETQYGPILIGGNSSELGAANIHFSRKMKLLRAIQNIEAEYVILDIGGDTSFNILDFFLVADRGIVMVTRDSASYIGSYQFMKAALYRKIQRIGGPESKIVSPEDAVPLDLLTTNTAMRSRLAKLASAQPDVQPDAEREPLKDLIARHTLSDDPVKSVAELLDIVTRERPADAKAVATAIRTFNPALVANKVPTGCDERQFVGKVQDVAAQFLSKKVPYLGRLSAHSDVEESTVAMVPSVVSNPEGKFAAELRAIADNLLASKRGKGPGRDAQDDYRQQFESSEGARETGRGASAAPSVS